MNVDPRRNPNNDLDLEEVVRYANDRGIGVWVYVNQRALAAQLRYDLAALPQMGHQRGSSSASCRSVRRCGRNGCTTL
ncbi:MAG: hypothetical protein ACLR8Y_11615 [Alistipes indistinctus]